MASRTLRWTIGFAAVVALAGAALTQHVGAQISAQRTTYLTFDHPVRLPGVALGAGTYIFELATPDGATDIVRVLSRDRATAYFMGFTRNVTRPSGLPSSNVVSLGEAKPGELRPVTVWWLSDESGRQFIYPETR